MPRDSPLTNRGDRIKIILEIAYMIMINYFVIFETLCQLFFRESAIIEGLKDDKDSCV